MLRVRNVILPLAKLAGTGHRGQMSAEPMSGLNPDEMDGEGAAFAKRRQLPRRKSQMASRIGCTFTMPVGESVSMIQSQLFSPGRTNVTENRQTVGK